MEIERDELVRRLGDVPLLDVRTDDEYHGRAGYPCDARQGHIRGARHVELGTLLGLTHEDLRALVDLPEGSELVVYCHSGARSALAAEALRAAGYDARNYVGSWHEWSADASLPADHSAPT